LNPLFFQPISLTNCFNAPLLLIFPEFSLDNS